ncbi:Hypothetical protein PHPALM_17950 [Phytophthora palmivora]|uniref:Uncharacterized protein n=1 Tax=Phytophthora palmivora TaxID=4796 RepID=A0A2P4XKZ0_9STRA|nr:Hypothetical protein PHPALM_17950 [Phytophthora palmivora]
MVSGEDNAHDPERLKALVELPLSVTGADQQQLMCAVGWFRDTLVDYGRMVKPLHDKLESVLSTVGSTRRLAAGVTLVWNEDERTAFQNIKQLIAGPALE